MAEQEDDTPGSEFVTLAKASEGSSVAGRRDCIGVVSSKCFYADVGCWYARSVCAFHECRRWAEGVLLVGHPMNSLEMSF